MFPDDPRTRIIEAAGEIFAEKGFKGGTVREIIQRAGVNLAAVNYYFRDKEGLYIDVVKTAICGAKGELPHWEPGTPPEQKLGDFIRHWMRIILGEKKVPWHRHVMMHEIMQPTSFCTAIIAEMIRPRAEMLIGIVGELVPHMPAEQRRLVAHSIAGQYLFYHLNMPIVSRLVGEEEFGNYTPDRLAEHILAFSLAALGGRPPLSMEKRGAK
jgi:TetR/AcrR family transcriptional regulator, regulator of cefoperazone and chloramphenicol sensitivity